MATRLCPINALEPMKILGLRQETWGHACLVYALIFLFVSPFTAIGVSIGVAYIGDKLGRNRPGNYVLYKLSIAINSSRFAQKHPFVKKATSVAWKEAGLLPPPPAQSTYEPS